MRTVQIGTRIQSHGAAVRLAKVCSVSLSAQARRTQAANADARTGRPLADFDLGNSPHEYTPARCKNTTLVLTTTNGTRALLRAAEAQRVLVAAFVNFSAVCEQLRQDRRPLHIVCAGTSGEITMEDTLLAGALVDCLSEAQEIRLNDGARLA